MSAHAGIRYRDRRPVPREVIECLTQDNAQLGPDRPGLHVDDGIAMLSFALAFDRLSREERQPVHTANHAVSTWDGRLDNRDALILRLHHELASDYSDARLAAEALRRWHTDALPELIGDWSLVVWNEGSHELILARDYAGNRPLYYTCQNEYVAWSTALSPLVALCDVADEIDESFFARLLTARPAETHTPYRGISLVRPGHYVHINDERVQQGRFARFKPRTIRYRDEADYQAHYRELLTEAVATRLRADGVVWTELSGGYDSSAIVCTANALVRAGQVEARGVQPVSIVTPAAPESDESVYIESVERFCGLKGVRLPFHQHDNLAAKLDWGGHLNDAGYATGVGSTDAAVEAAGSRVLLSGEVGDVITAGTAAEDALLDRLTHGEWRIFFRDCLTYCRESRSTMLSRLGAVIGRPRRVSQLTRNGLKPDLRERAKLRRVKSTDPATIFAVTQDVVRRALADDTTDADDDLANLPLMKRELLLSLRRFVAGNSLNGTRSARAIGVTYPYSHRPLVDLMLGIPPRVLWRPDRHRGFVCAALADVMPGQVLARGTKGYAMPAVSRALVPAAMEASQQGVDTWEVVTRRLCDPAALSKMLAGLLDGSEVSAGMIEQVLLVESMLRALRPRGDADSGARSGRVPATSRHEAGLLGAAIEAASSRS